MRDGLIILIGRVLIMMTSIVSIRIFTTILSPTEIGRLNLLLGISGWFSMVLLSSIGTYMNRKILEWDDDGLAYKSLLLWFKYLLVVSIFAGCSTLILMQFIDLGIQIGGTWVLVIMIGTVLMGSGNSMIISLLNLFDKRFWFVFSSVMTSWIGLIIATSLTLWISRNAEHWILGQIISQGLLFLFATMILLRFLKQKSTSKIQALNAGFDIKTMFRFVWPLTIAALLYWVQTQGYRFLFIEIADLKSLGFLVVGMGIGSSFMVAFDTLFSQYYHPIFYAEIAHSNEVQRTKAWNKYVSAFFPSAIMMAIFLAVNGPMLAVVFTGPEFHQVGTIVIWGVLAEFLRILSTATSMISHAQLKMKALIAPAVTGVLVMLIAMIVLVPINTFHGGGLAITLGWVASLMHLYKNMKTLLPVKIPWRRILYSSIMGLPLIIVYIFINDILTVPTTVQSLFILAISGLYFLITQFLLSRKWLSIPFKIRFIEYLEQKMKNLYPN
jgi:O-antigen/teichoic acid export membrane protein